MAMESATSKGSGPQPTDLPQRGWEDKVESFPKVFLLISSQTSKPQSLAALCNRG
jgi:hypothetical protein